MFSYKEKVSSILNFLLILGIILFILFMLNCFYYDTFFSYFGLSKYQINAILSFSTIISFLIIFIILKITFKKQVYEYNSELITQKNELEESNRKLKESNQVLKYQLYIDPLTNLQNRRALERDISSAKEPKLILLDIDSFTDINEYYGNSIGDFILVEIAQILKEFVNKEGMSLYRLGADEFALLEDTPLDVGRYEELAEELLSMFKSRMMYVPAIDKDVEINITLGFSLDETSLLEKALLALSKAKEKQIDYLCYFKNIDTKERFIEQIKWSDFIKKALKENRVIPFYQPIFDSSGRIVKHECLVRILDENEEVIPPGLFLEVAKKVKRYSEIEKHLIDKSFAMIADNNKVISINLLARDMSDGNVSSYVISKLNEYNVAKRVVFEILEDESIKNISRVGAFIRKVKKMGCQIAVDDFGTGYSNFSYLMELQPDYIKIDGSLIKNLDKDRNSLAIVTSIITFARKLGIKTVAEYVHSEAIFEICLDLGIDEFQGFYLGEPSSRLR